MNGAALAERICLGRLDSDADARGSCAGVHFDILHAQMNRGGGGGEVAKEGIVNSADRRNPNYPSVHAAQNIQ